MGSSQAPSGGTTFSYIGPSSTACAAASATCAFTYSPTNGNLVVAYITCRDSTASDPPTITTDNGSSTWTNLLASGQQSGSDYYNEDYTLSVAGSPTTITAHCGASTTATTLVVGEYHRTSGSWVAGTVASQANGTGTTATGNTVTPTSSVPALIIGYFTSENNATGTWLTANTTIRINKGDTSGNSTLGAGDQIVSSASGTYAASATIASSVSWRCWTSWFK